MKEGSRVCAQVAAVRKCLYTYKNVVFFNLYTGKLVLEKFAKMQENRY